MSLLLSYLIQLVIALLLILVFISLNGLILVWLERKIAAYIQRRLGPYEVGPYGLLQPVADALKLISKQLVMPRGADPLLYWLAPIISVMPLPLCILSIPFSPLLTGVQLNIGLVLVLAFSAINVLSLCLAGLGSNNKYALLGAARAVSQAVAYEIPLLLSVLSVTFISGSLNMNIIVEQQVGIFSWNIWVQPVSFVIFFIAATAETNRAPFDLPEAESELIAGHHTEYSGISFALFMLAEYIYMVIICGIGVSLFLGGWDGPFCPGCWWVIIKIYGMLIILMWFRWTFPRVRFDQLLNICWQWLIPLGLINLLITAFFIKLFRLG